MPYGRARATCSSSDSAPLTGEVAAASLSGNNVIASCAATTLSTILPRLCAVAGYCCWVTTAATL